ncbi:MAG: tetratricopeptide repeat protein [Bryobacterales bacterium]
MLRQAAALESRGRIDLAVQTWQRTLLANPDQPEALFGLARDAKRRGDLPEVERLLARLRVLAPGRPEIDEIESMRVIAGKEDQLAEARRLAAAQQYEQAMAIYREVVGPAAPAGGLATSYYETEAATPGGWPRAVGALRRLAARFPTASGYKLSLGRLLTYRPETRIEGVEILRSVSGDPDAERVARSSWRQALVWEGPSARAVPALETYLGGGSDPELEEILRQSRSAASARVDNGGASESRGYAALDEGRLADAEKAFLETLRTTPRSAGALAGLGYVRMKQERFENAEEYLRRSLELAPDDQVAQEALTTSRFWSSINAAKLALDRNEVEEAIAGFRRALELQPGSIDAISGLAGALMAEGRAAEAAPLFERVVAARPDDLASWRALLRTIYDSDGAVATLSRHQRIPESTALALERDPAHLMLMATVYSKTDQQSQFDLAFQKVLRLTPNEADAMSPIRLQFAGLLNEMGRSLEAAAEYERAVEADPENIDAWEGLLAALMHEHNGRAMAVLSRMPRDVYDRALERPGFLFNIGLIHMAANRPEEAAVFFRSAVGLGDKLGREQLIAARLQLARIHATRLNWAEAEKSLRDLAAEYPQEADVWKSLISNLQEQGRSEEALATADRIPATVITRLYNDPGYVALMASIHNARKNYTEGLRMVRDAIAIHRAEKRAVPTELEIQLGWLLLNSEADPHELLALMQEASARPGLTEKQRSEFGELWTVWSLREAKAASEFGDFDRATAILQSAVRLFPEDNRLYSALAGSLLDAGDPSRALLVYRSWGLDGASPEDFAGAIGSAMTMRDQRSASRWLRESLRRWPKNPDLLTLAGQDAASRGDYRRAEEYWALALQALPESQGGLEQQLISGAVQHSETEDLGRLLAGVVGEPAVDRYRPQMAAENPTAADLVDDARDANSLSAVLLCNAGQPKPAAPVSAARSFPSLRADTGNPIQHDRWKNAGRRLRQHGRCRPCRLTPNRGLLLPTGRL